MLCASPLRSRPGLSLPPASPSGLPPPSSEGGKTGESSQTTSSCTRPTTPPLRIRSAPPLTQGRQGAGGRSWLSTALPGGKGRWDAARSEGAKAPCQFPGGGKISENRRLTKFGKTGILRPLPNRSQPEGGAQDDQRKHGLVRIGRKEAWTEGALRTHAALRSKTAFFARSLSFCRTGSAFFAPFRRSLLFCKEDIVSWNRKPSSRPGKRPR